MGIDQRFELRDRARSVAAVVEEQYLQAPVALSKHRGHGLLDQLRPIEVQDAHGHQRRPADLDRPRGREIREEPAPGCLPVRPTRGHAQRPPPAAASARASAIASGNGSTATPAASNGSPTAVPRPMRAGAPCSTGASDASSAKKSSQ